MGAGRQWDSPLDRDEHSRIGEDEDDPETGQGEVGPPEPGGKPVVLRSSREAERKHRDAW